MKPNWLGTPNVPHYFRRVLSPKMPAPCNCKLSSHYHIVSELILVRMMSTGMVQKKIKKGIRTYIDHAERLFICTDQRDVPVIRY